MLFLLFYKNEITSVFKIFCLKHKAWNDYYPNEKPTDQFSNLIFNSHNETLSPIRGNSYVFNCYFYSLRAENGAAIYSTQTSNLLVEKCSIYNCTATQNTAGIRVTKGNCIISYVCSQYGYAGTYDGFCTITNEDNTRTINSMFSSSISHCEANIYNIVALYYGSISIKSVNLSHNKSNSTSALGCQPNKINTQTGYGTDVLYCSFSNNTATSQHCIYFNYDNLADKYEIKKCNIIENNATKTIYSRGNTDIISSCILKNKEPNFYTYDSSSNIYLILCSVDNINEKGLGSLTSHGTTTTFLHGLTFISTGFCESSFDCFGSLIPSSPEQIKIYHCSSFIISLHRNLFLISFLHSQ